MFNQNNHLFQKTTLDAYLRMASEELHSLIRGLEPEKIMAAEEGPLVTELVQKYNLRVPVILEDKISIDANEADITFRSYGVFDDDYDPKHITQKGLRITVNLPFEGDSELFQCRPSTYVISDYPIADIQNGLLILNYETVEKDPIKIKALWQKDIANIKQNLGWIEKDLQQHNQRLEQIIRAQLTLRKQEAQNNQSLIDMIKNG